MLEEIKKVSNLVVTSIKDKKLSRAYLEKMFKKIGDNADRDKKIMAAEKKGYSQHAIAECLGYTQAYINKIVKRMRGVVATDPLEKLR